MRTSSTRLRDQVDAHAQHVREAFGLSSREDLTTRPLQQLDLDDDVTTRLAAFNIEWYVIPSSSLVPFDSGYLVKMYAHRSPAFDEARYEALSIRQMLESAHQRVQGTIVGIEATEKPYYVPGTHAFYGTRYGLDPAFDPFRMYFERAGLTSGPRFINSRFAHTPGTLRSLGEIVKADWRSRGLVPPGYELTVCPPTVFNLVGMLFHSEWSQTPTLELSAYRDDRGNGVGLAVGSNGPGDFSYVRCVESDADLSQLGFRVALVPDSQGGR